MSQTRNALMITSLLTCTLAMPVYADYSMPEAQREGGVSYITGGIGDEERTALKSVKDHYNLAVMSAGKSGAFVGDAHIVIRDHDGRPVVNETDAGPLFYAKLPAGHYVVEESSEGIQRKQAVTIASDQTAHVNFSMK